MTTNPNLPEILAKSESIARCREALDSDDMLAVAPRDDWSDLLDMADEMERALIASQPILQAALEVARAARTCPPGFTDDIDNPDSLWTGHRLDQAVEKLVLAVEAKHGRAS